MKPAIIGLWVIAILVALGRGLLHLQAWRWTRRGSDKRLDPDRLSAKTKSKLLPESLFIVRFSDEGVSCDHPDGKVEGVLWEDLHRVEILTTSAGPYFPDVFWILSGTESGCVIPWDATGDRELLARLQRLPQFDNAAVGKATTCTDDRMFLCWQRPA